MKMKRVLLLLSTIIACFSQISARDHIILRNGQEYDVKLYQINDEKIVFDYANGQSAQRQEVASSDAYMVYIEKQGNVYLNADGKRRTGESKRVDPRRYDAIYLISGAEIGTTDIKITDNEIIYASGNRGKAKPNERAINKSEVFMIRYKSGMIDIVTPIDKPKQPEADAQQTAAEPQLVVVFHEVKRGDTLDKVAKKYSVSVDDLREWNDISKKTKSTSLLTSGMQLMIYQPKN
jgi:LysM repeat protein